MPRARLVLVSVLLAVSTTLALVPPATSAQSADVIRSGFRIKGDGTAGGYWVGSRSTGGQVVYRIDPGKTKTYTSGFGTRLWRSTLKGLGPHRVTTRDTARAAWILAKYGTYRYDIQNAGVEIALDHLLYGGSWSLNGSRTASRLATLPDRDLIRSFATTMLADSARYAGPYRATVYAAGTQVGGAIPVTVRVRATTSGDGVPLLPVTVSGPGGSRSLRTGADGLVKTTFPATAAGPTTITVRVEKVPETRLQIRAPQTSGMSRIAVAGLKTTLTAATTTAVRANPGLVLRSTQNPMTTTEPAPGEFSLSGSYPSARTATASLFGPFSSAAAATCSSTARVGSASVPVSGNGTRPLPQTLVPSSPGYYLWGMYVPGDTYNNAVSACGGVAQALAVPSLRISTGATEILAGTPTTPQLVVSGLPVGYSGTATLRLYGPVGQRSDLTCTSGTLFHTQTIQVTGNRTYTGVPVMLFPAGYYGWSVTLPGSATTAPSSTGCAPTGASVHVTYW